MHLPMPREVENPLLGEGVGSGPVEVGVRKEAERERAVLVTVHYLLTLSNIHSVINGKLAYLVVASNKEYTLVGRFFDVQSGNSAKVRERGAGGVPSFRPNSRVTQEILQQLVNHLGSCRFLGDEALQHVACLHRQIIGMLSIPFESNDVS